MAESIIQKMIYNDSIIKQKVKKGSLKLTMIYKSKLIELQLIDDYLIYDKNYIKYKDIKCIKEFINEPTTFIYSGKRYAIIRSPNISIEYYQNFIYALKLKTIENKERI